MSEETNNDLDLSGLFGGAGGNGATATATEEMPAVLRSEVAKAVASDLSPPTHRKGRVPLIVDLETVPDESRMSQFGLDPLPTPRTFTPADQLPDPVALVGKKVDEIKKALDGLWPPKEWIELAKQKEMLVNEKPRKGVIDELNGLSKLQAGEAGTIQDAVEAQRKLLSVTPEYCRIVAMGSARGTAEIRTAVVGQVIEGHTIEESDLLESFWAAVEECSPLVGFNILGFDLPVIFIRSSILGIRPSRKIDLKPWGGDCIDLMKVRWPTGGQKGLKDIARILGFTVPAEGVDGSHVFKLWQEKKLDEITKYQSSDIDVTRRYYDFLRGYFF